MTALVAIPFFVYNQLGGEEAMSGAFGAGQMGAYALSCMVAARMVHRARNGIHWAMKALVVFALVLCAMPLFRVPWLCGLMVAAAFSCQAFVWPALHSWVGAEPDPARRTRHMGWFNLSWSFGFALSPLYTGPLVDIDYRLSFVALFVLCAAGFLLLWSLPHERDYFGVVTAEQLDARADHDRLSEIHLYYAWFATFLANVLAGITRMVYPKRVKDLVADEALRLFWEDAPLEFLTSGAATKYSWLAAGLALATSLSFLAFGKWKFWRHSFAFLMGMELAAGLAFWFLGHTTSLFVMMLAFVIVGAMLGAAFFASVYYSLSNPDLKHRRATINEAAVGLGGFLGSIVFGQLVARYGVAHPYHAMPLVILACVVVQWLLLRHGAARFRRLQARAKSAA